MRCPRRPALEPLEQRALLSTATVASAASTPAQASTTTQGLVVTLTTDHRVYRVGQPVVVSVTQTNASTEGISVAAGPSTSGFVAMRGGRTVWSSQKGMQPMFQASRTLQPGASISWSATWNGRAKNGPLLGRLTIASQLPNTPSVTVMIRRPA